MSVFNEMSKYLNKVSQERDASSEHNSQVPNPADIILRVEYAWHANPLDSKEAIFNDLDEADKFGKTTYAEFFKAVVEARGKISHALQITMPFDVIIWLKDIGLEILLTTESDTLLDQFNKHGQ